MTDDQTWCNGAGIPDAGSEAHRPIRSTILEEEGPQGQHPLLVH